MLRPSATLTFSLFGPEATQENASALKRSYSYIAPTLVKAQKPAEDETFDPESIPVENVISMTVRLPKNPYWLDADEHAAATWSEIVLPWVAMKLGTLFETDGQHIEIGIEPDNSLRDVAPVLKHIRTYLNSEGVDVGAIMRIVAPSDAVRGESDWLDITFADGTSAKVEL